MNVPIAILIAWIVFCGWVRIATIGKKPTKERTMAFHATVVVLEIAFTVGVFMLGVWYARAAT